MTQCPVHFPGSTTKITRQPISEGGPRCVQSIKHLVAPVFIYHVFLAGPARLAMDKLRAKFGPKHHHHRHGQPTSGPTRGLHSPPASLLPCDNSSTHAVNEDIAARDFAASPASQSHAHGVLTVEPPTSLQSSIDAGVHVPKPSRYNDPSSLVSHRYPEM